MGIKFEELFDPNNGDLLIPTIYHLEFKPEGCEHYSKIHVGQFSNDALMAISIAIAGNIVAAGHEYRNARKEGEEPK